MAGGEHPHPPAGRVDGDDLGVAPVAVRVPLRDDHTSAARIPGLRLRWSREYGRHDGDRRDDANAAAPHGSPSPYLGSVGRAEPIGAER